MNSKQTKLLRKVLKTEYALSNKSLDTFYTHINEKQNHKMYIKPVKMVEDESGNMVEQKINPKFGGMPAFFEYMSSTVILDDCYRKEYKQAKKQVKTHEACDCHH